MHNAGRRSLGPRHDEERPRGPYRGAMPLGVEVPAVGYDQNAVTAHDGAEEEGLRIDAVTVRFDGLTALEDVSLAVSPGEVVGVIGPNGAGKTTLFNVVCGFVRPDAGAVTW